MATNPTPPLVNWAYADWRSQATNALKLARLQLHLEEVSGFVLTSSSKGRSVMLQQDYLKQLKEYEADYEQRVAVSVLSRAGRTAAFVRGSGP